MFKMIKLYLPCVLLLFSTLIKAQQDFIFTSLEEALKTPELVIKLDLTMNLKQLRSPVLDGSYAEEIDKSTFHEFPTEVLSFPNLEWLVLDKHKIPTLPKSLNRLKKLKFISIEQNGISQIEQGFQPESLVQLRIQKNNISVLPESVCSINSLEVLDIGLNPLKELPISIGNLKNLKTLNLNLCALESLPETIGNLNNLEVAVLSTVLTDLPDSFKKLEKLRTLYLEFNSLTEFPPELETLTSLESLIIYSNEEGSGKINIPEWFGNLINLTEIYFSVSQFYQLPNSIGNLQKLRILDLGHCIHLESLPDSIKLLQKLRTLEVAHTDLNDQEIKDLKFMLPMCNIWTD